MVEIDDTNRWKKLVQQKRKREKAEPKEMSPEKQKEQIKKWTTFYRRNINLYASERLKIRLHPFQHVMLYLMSHSQVFFAMCSRGLSKTFMVGLFNICMAMLYPYTEGVITSSTIAQASKMVTDKMENELCKKLSPVLKYLYEQGQIKFEYNQENIKMRFLFNGSCIKVLPCIDSSRGERATILTYEECRLLKKSAIDSIFEPMSHPRQPKYLSKQEYANDTRLREECKSIYITSARFKNEWFYNMFKSTVNGAFNDKKVAYNFYAGDIFVAIKHGLKTESDLAKAKKTSSELDIRMELYNEMIGEAENAYFTLDMFRKNQVLRKAFKPPTVEQLVNKIDLKNPVKKDNEYRFIAVDLAFANSTTRWSNDNTVILCFSCMFDGSKFFRRLDYIETCNGGDSEGTERRIRELFKLYEADYLVMDLRNGGETYYSNLSKEYIHPEFPSEFWNEHGFAVSQEMDLQVVSSGKIEDLSSRTIDPNAIPVIIPIIGSAELNSTMWQELHKNLIEGSIKFLLDEMEFDQSMSEKKDYMTMSSHQKMQIKLPYVQTLLLINEAINLNQTWKDGKLKLEEKTSAFKDRIVILSYVNYIATLLENRLAIQSQNNDFDISQWNIIF